MELLKVFDDYFLISCFPILQLPNLIFRVIVYKNINFKKL